jgi:hypothetical protein
MSRLMWLRVGALVLGLALFVMIAPTASAAEPQPTGSYSYWFYNYIDEGGAACPAAGAIFGGSETDINHFWQEFTSPFPGVNNSNYMVCWNGTLNFPVAGNWTVHTVNDDGMDVYVDGQITMHGWYDQGPSLHDGTINLGAGSHNVIVKYYNRTYGGTACVGWGPANNPIPWWQCPKQPTTVVQLPPPPKPKPCYLMYGCYAPKPPPVYSCYYRVQYGDNLTLIAWRYHTTIWWLMQTNNIWNPNYIYAGMLMRVC